MHAHATNSTNPNTHLWAVGQRSETGYVRTENQDRMSWIRANAADVFVVSDGMGGHAGGATAASIAVQVMQEELQALSSLDNMQATLERALQAANAAIFARGQMPNPLTAGMGATIVALLAAGERIMLAHVGDSRAYRLDRRGALHRLTKDHSVVQRMIDHGVLTETEAANHPDASVLERALGQTPRVAVEVSGWIELQHGDVCMLCSDGLCGYVDDHAIAAVMRESGTPQAIADRLVRLALDAGGEDNVTVEVMRCGDSRGTRLRRWFGRAALALAAVCAAAAAMVSQGMFGLRERPVAKVVPAASATVAPSRLTAPDEAASLDAQIAAKQHELDDLHKRRAALVGSVASAPVPASSAAASSVKALAGSVASAPATGPSSVKALAGSAASAPVPASSAAASSVKAVAKPPATHPAHKPTASHSTNTTAPNQAVRGNRTASQPSENE